MGSPLASRERRAVGRRLTLAAVLALALGGGGAQAAPAAPAAVGRVVSARAVAPPPAAAPVARAAADRSSGGAAVDVGAAAARSATAAQTTPRARSAAAHTATIAGFAFHPASVTVAAGDTIAWTNEDAAAHTVTADDGSFDTGRLDKGASGSHTFTTAGTFAYHCTIHPTMHGTVTVLARAAGAPAGGSGAPAGGSAAPPSAAPAPGRPVLPRTGWDAAAVAAMGVALLLAGVALRIRTRPV